MPASIDTTIKAEATATAIGAATGQYPQVLYTDDTANIIFTEAQGKAIRDFIEKQLAAPKGKINLELMPVIMPLVLKKALPPAILAAVGLLLIGYHLGKK